MSSEATTTPNGVNLSVAADKIARSCLGMLEKLSVDEVVRRVVFPWEQLREWLGSQAEFLVPQLVAAGCLKDNDNGTYSPLPPLFDFKGRWQGK